MSKNYRKVLAIDPGTQEMGVAFLENGKLIYYGVRTFNNRRSPHETLEEGRKIILRLIRDFKPNILVFEKAFFANNRSAASLNTFVAEIKALGKRKGLEVLSFAPIRSRKLSTAMAGPAKKKWLESLSPNTLS